MSAVNEAIARVSNTGRFGTRKVFVSAVWDALGTAHRAGLTLDHFKVALFAAHRAQLVSLVRADLVAAMPGGLVAASEMEPASGVTFHFIIDPRASEPWS